MRKFIYSFLALLAAAGVGFYSYLNRNYYPPILMYHSLDPSRHSTPSMSGKDFREQMEYIKRHKFKVISLADLARDLKQGKVPRHTLVITFDDGYKDNLKAVKILKKFGFPATIFMITGNIGRKGFLTAEDLKYIEDKTPINIGAHTYSHAYMPNVNSKDYNKEINLPKKILESILGKRKFCFSYPVGGFNRRVEQAVKKAGFLCAVTTNRGYSKAIDTFALRRVKISAQNRSLDLWAKLSGYYYVFKKIKSPQ